MMSLVDLWPVLAVRVRTRFVELVVPTGDDLAEVAELAGKGIYDPQSHFLPRTPVAGWADLESPEAERHFLRYYWACLADWRPEKWNLLLAARAGDRVVGVQEIVAQNFSVTRTVSTGSWVGQAYQGAGHGTAMRQAALHLAFVGLSADRADTAAWVTNEASLGVSHALGYQPNGTTVGAVDGRRIEQVNLTLQHSEWHSRDTDFSILGLTPDVRELFGCPAQN